MKRKAVLAIAAAVAVAAVVVLTTGAFAGTPGKSNHPGGGDLVACLATHGVQVPSDDPAGVKQWLGDHESDPAVQAALQACQPSDGTDTGPTPAQLVTCLERHGVDVPSDVKENPDALKPWLAEAVKQPDVSAALDACTGGPPQSQTK